MQTKAQKKSADKAIIRRQRAKSVKLHKAKKATAAKPPTAPTTGTTTKGAGLGALARKVRAKRKKPPQ